MTELLQILYKRQWYILEGSEAGKEKLNRKDLLSVSMSGVREVEEPKRDTIFFFPPSNQNSEIIFDFK